MAVYRALYNLKVEIEDLTTFTNLKLGAQKSIIRLYRKKVLETIICARTQEIYFFSRRRIGKQMYFFGSKIENFKKARN